LPFIFDEILDLEVDFFEIFSSNARKINSPGKIQVLSDFEEKNPFHDLCWSEKFHCHGKNEVCCSEEKNF